MLSVRLPKMQFAPGDSSIIRQVVEGLSGQLNFMTTYLTDLKHQYGDTPGLATASDMLAQLAQRQAPSARAGSAQ